MSCYTFEFSSLLSSLYSPLSSAPPVPIYFYVVTRFFVFLSVANIFPSSLTYHPRLPYHSNHLSKNYTNQEEPNQDKPKYYLSKRNLGANCQDCFTACYRCNLWTLLSSIPEHVLSGDGILEPANWNVTKHDLWMSRRAMLSASDGLPLCTSSFQKR